jgi:hypothetical protein
MPQDHTPVTGASDAEVMASVDASSSRPSYVIADVTRDEAWLSVSQTDAPVLAEWC